MYTTGDAQHSPFANSLQRIGKHTAFACGECKGECIGLAIRFSEWQMANERRRLGFADFNAKAKWQKCQYNDAHCQYLSLKKLKC